MHGMLDDDILVGLKNSLHRLVDAATKVGVHILDGGGGRGGGGLHGGGWRVRSAGEDDEG